MSILRQATSYRGFILSSQEEPGAGQSISALGQKRTRTRRFLCRKLLSSSCERANQPQASIPGQLVSARRRCYVLNACARAVEDRNLVVSQPPRPMLRNKGPKFGSDIRR